MKFFFHRASVILFCVLFAQVILGSNNHQLKLHVTKLPQTPVVLKSVKGDRQIPVDTVMPSASGEIVFQFKESYVPGMYLVTVQSMTLWQFIYNEESIEAKVALGAPFESVQIIKSDENIAYYNFLRFQNKIVTQVEIVQSVLDNYPISEEFHSQAIAEYTRLENELSDLYSSAMIGNTVSLAKSYISASRELVVPLQIPAILKTEYIQEHYWDYMPFSDTSLIYSDILTHKALLYYGYFSSQNATKEQNFKGYLAGSDTILKKAMPYPTVYNFIANYLIDGFEGIGQEPVADFIAEQYAELNSCEKKDEMSTLETKVYNRTKLKNGTDAPHFKLKNDKIEYSYSGETDKVVVLIFWATWCQHCMEVMPNLNRVLQRFTKQNVDVLTVSLDTDKKQWTNFVENNDFDGFRNFIATGGWESKIARDYAIYGTPSIYVIHDGKIIGKPLDIESIPIVLSDVLK